MSHIFHKHLVMDTSVTHIPMGLLMQLLPRTRLRRQAGQVFFQRMCIFPTFFSLLERGHVSPVRRCLVNVHHGAVCMYNGMASGLYNLRRQFVLKRQIGWGSGVNLSSCR